MSLDTYRSLDQARDPGARDYLAMHFEALFTEAIGEFAYVGWLAIGTAATVIIAAFASWVRLRNRLPARWFWLLPLAGLTIYASLKSAVVFELIRQAPDLPQMWSLYFKSSTPLRMVRTPVLGLVSLTALLWALAAWHTRRKTSAQGADPTPKYRDAA